ncbi:MAG: hypothetical protein IKD76_04055 [Clostridia bacterium]|nr:hypothetical protein [Clostridia bacterium]
MEDNNFQKNLNNVEENVNNVGESQVNENNEKSINNTKRKTVTLLTVVLVLVLVVGLVIGIVIAGKGKDDATNSGVTTNKTTEANKTTEVNEKKEENKSSKKVDESKEWVYDADYVSQKAEKTRTSGDVTFRTTEQIKLPYLNINSEDAKRVNEELKTIAEKAYTDFGKSVTITDGSTKKEYTSDSAFEFTKYSYNYYTNNNILSIVIQRMAIAVPGDGSTSYLTFNFNLETLKLIDVEDVLQQCNFKSKTDFDNKLKIEIKNAETRGEAVSEDYSKWDGKRFFVKGNKINVILPGLAMGEYVVEVNPDAVAVSTEKENVNTKENIKINEEFFSLELPASWKGKYKYETVNGDGVVTCEFRIVSSNAKLFEVIKSDKEMLNVPGVTLLKQTGNKYYYFATPTDTPDDSSEYAELYKIIGNGSIINDVKIIEEQEKETKATSENKETVDKQSKSDSLPQAKTKKQLSPSGWAGSSMQEIRLYDNGDVYHVTYNGEGQADSNIVSVELIAKNAETIEEKGNDLVVEAIIVKGKNLNVLKNNESWVLFEKN